MATGSKNTILKLKVYSGSGRLGLKCQLASCFNNTVSNIEIKCTACTLTTTAVRRRSLNVSIGYVECNARAGKGCAGHDKRRSKSCLVSSLSIGNSTVDIEGTTMTDYQSAGTNDLKASALTDIDSSISVANIEASDLRMSCEGNVASCIYGIIYIFTICIYIVACNRFTVTVKSNACGKSNTRIESYVSKKRYNVALICSCDCACEGFVLNAVNLCNVDNRPNLLAINRDFSFNTAGAVPTRVKPHCALSRGSAIIHSQVNRLNGATVYLYSAFGRFCITSIGEGTT